MAGGIFPGYPFKPNVKCVVGSFLLAGGYWYLPPKNLWVLGTILWATYLLIAWYDYAYQCQDRMSPTLFPFGRYVYLPLKPPDYKQEFEALPPEAIQAMDRLDHMASWVLLGAISVFVFYKKK